MLIQKVVIWGHKLHSHTHSYIHNGFYLAFKNLGYNTLWFDDNDDVSNIDFSNSLFLTEHQVNKKIPCRKDCLYLTHYIDEGDYTGVPKENIIILKVSPRDFYECDKNKNYTYSKLDYGIEHEYHSKIDGYNCLYIYWATDLLPHEIDNNIQKLSNIQNENKIHFIGSVTQVWRQFREICNYYGVEFCQYGATFNSNSHMNKSIDENIDLVQRSIISPALQDNGQVQYKYVPCRIFKNISYGKMGLTNNEFVYELFNKKIIYDSDIRELFKKGIEFEMRGDKSDIIKELMIYVKNNHTYLNRISTIQKYIKQYTSFEF